MTKHLYYDDSYMTEFAAVVLEQINVGQKPAVVLDRTAFIPHREVSRAIRGCWGACGWKSWKRMPREESSTCSHRRWRRER